MQNVMRRMGGVLVVCASVWAANGCGDDKNDDSGATTEQTSGPLTTTGPDTPTSEGTSEDSTDTGVVDPSTTTTTATTEEPTTGEPTTEDPTTGGQTGMCDPQAQDCDEGFKCTAYALLPGDEWNANKCVPEPQEGGVAGDDCTVEGDDVFTGIDDCAKGYICLNADKNTKVGFCVEFCSGADLCPNTSGGDGLCIQANDGLLPICLQTCDPLLQDCAGQQACYGDVSGPPFICFNPDPQGNDGTAGDSCEFTNACVGGLHCAPASTQDGCDPMSMGCCTEFCALDEMTCQDPEECVPFFSSPQVGYENVGICALPG